MAKLCRLFHWWVRVHNPALNYCQRCGVRLRSRLRWSRYTNSGWVVEDADWSRFAALDKNGEPIKKRDNTSEYPPKKFCSEPSPVPSVSQQTETTKGNNMSTSLPTSEPQHGTIQWMGRRSGSIYNTEGTYKIGADEQVLELCDDRWLPGLHTSDVISFTPTEKKVGP